MQSKNIMTRVTRAVAMFVLAMFAATITTVLLSACVSQNVRLNTYECNNGEIVLLPSNCGVE